ncbi:MAG: recombinase family protein [Firmicutes bacterium]|nr:recombinase family protein [Bacillota bacterium]
MTMIDTIGIYVRVSTQEQSENGYSIDEQLNRLKKYCEAHDWGLVKEYADGGHSGAKLERPALRELIKDVQEKKISKVIVYKLDRLSRSQKDTLYLIEDVFLKNNVDFVSMSENFDTSTPFGKAMIGILSVFAQLEREQIKERMMMGKVGRAKSGKWLGSSNRPTGYDVVDGELVINEYEAQIVKLIFKLYNDGFGTVAIRNRLFELGYKARKGEFSKISVQTILKNAVYIGKVNFQGVQYDGDHDPIISEKEYYKAQERMKRNKENPRFASISGQFTGSAKFTGLFKCGCGKSMILTYGPKKKDGTNYKYYKCVERTVKGGKCKIESKSIKADVLESAVLTELKNFQLDPELFVSQIRKEKQKDPVKEDKIEIDQIRKHIKEIENKSRKLIDLYQISAIDFEEVTARATALNDEKIKLTDRLNELEKEAGKNSSEDLSEREAIELINNLDLSCLELDKVLDEATAFEVNKIMKTLINKIVVTGNQIDFYWNF